MRIPGLRRRWPPSGRAVLWMLLVAALLAPVPATLWGARLAGPHGLRREDLAALALLVLVIQLLHAARRVGWPGVRRVAARAVATLALSTVFAVVVDRRSSGFYTDTALLEGMAMLLVLHGAASALRRLAPPIRERRLRRIRGRAMSTTDLADGLTTAVATLVGAFWVLSVLNAREAALVLMMTAGMLAILTVLLRLADAAHRIDRPALPT